MSTNLWGFSQRKRNPQRPPSLTPRPQVMSHASHPHEFGYTAVQYKVLSLTHMRMQLFYNLPGAFATIQTPLPPRGGEGDRSDVICLLGTRRRTSCIECQRYLVWGLACFVVDSPEYCSRTEALQFLMLCHIALDSTRGVDLLPLSRGKTFEEALKSEHDFFARHVRLQPLQADLQSVADMDEGPG